jgi:hypothetical protein
MRKRFATTDIAEAGFGMFGDDAEGCERAGSGGSGCDLNGFEEGRGIADHVVRRKHQDNAFWIKFGDHRSRGRDRGCGVSGDGFEGDRLGFDACGSQLLGNDEAMGVVAEDERRRKERGIGNAERRVLEQSLLAGERKKLLRERAAGERPKARAGAAGQNDGVDSSCGASRGSRHSKRGPC